MGIAPFFQSYIRASIITSIFLTATLVATIYAISPHKKQAATALILGTPMLAIMWAAFFINLPLSLAITGKLFAILFTGYTTLSIFSFIMRQAAVTKDVIHAALGYGDITPVTDKTQALSILEAILGQMYLIFQVSWLVGRYTSQSARDTTAND